MNTAGIRGRVEESPRFGLKIWFRACNIAPSADAAQVFAQTTALRRIGIRLEMTIKTRLDRIAVRMVGAGRRPRRQQLTLLMLSCLGLAACDSEGGRIRPPSTEVNVIHVARNFGNLEFRRVERREATLGYRTSSVFTWDSDTYTFNLDSILPGAEIPIRLYTFEAELTEGNDYSIVLTEANGWLRELVVEAPASEISESEAEILVTHTASQIGPVDLYLEPPGTELAAATPKGTVAFLESVPVATVTPGEFEVSLTQVNNPTSVVMASSPFDLAGAVRTTLTIIGGVTPASPAAVLASGGGTDMLLADRDLRSGLRVLNAMTSRDALDVTVDGNFSPPLVPGARFAVPSEYALIIPGEHTLMVTPAGNPGAIEIEQSFLALPGQRGTWFIRGDPGELAAAYSSDSQRRVRGVAEVTVYFGGTVVSGVDVFIVAPDTDLDTIAPTATMTDTNAVSRLLMGLGGYTVTLRESSTQNVLAGPVAAALDIEGNYGIVVTNGATGSGLDITLIDAFSTE